MIAVSVKRLSPDVALHISADNGLEVPSLGAGGVVLVDLAACSVLSVLAGHRDVVRCMCGTPDGRLVTAGGKHDAKCLVWDRAQWEDGQEGVALEQEENGQVGDDNAIASSVLRHPAQRLKDPGFVNALVTVMDTKPGSPFFALAGARYNAVKICL